MMQFSAYYKWIRSRDSDYTITTSLADRNWRIHKSVQGEITLLRGHEGAGGIRTGRQPYGSTSLLWLVGSSPQTVRINGMRLSPGTVAIIQPNADYVIASLGESKWCELLLSCSFRENANCDSQAAQAEQVPVSVVNFSGALRDSLGPFSDLLTSKCLELAATDSRLPIEQIRASLRCSGACVSNQNEYVQLVLSAMKMINNGMQSEMTVRDISQASDISERCLLRAFHSILSMGPKRYLLLKQLNNVREMLSESTATVRRVTDIMMDCGLSEFGRAAGQYKLLFGEVPSVTLKCSNVLPSNLEQ